MDKVLKFIDKYIDKIPIHIRDIIQKGFIALTALALLLAIVYGINRGMRESLPSGVKLFEKSRDLFYTDELKNENKNRIKLIEDVELNLFIQEKSDERLYPALRRLGKDTSNHMIGESGDMIQKENRLSEKDKNLFMEEDPVYKNIEPQSDFLEKKDNLNFSVPLENDSLIKESPIKDATESRPNQSGSGKNKNSLDLIE